MSGWATAPSVRPCRPPVVRRRAEETGRAQRPHHPGPGPGAVLAGAIAAGRLGHGHRPSETDDMVNPGTRMGGIAASVKPSISRGSVRTVAPTSVVRRSTSSGE